jgi:hypothetical protein
VSGDRFNLQGGHGLKPTKRQRIWAALILFSPVLIVASCVAVARACREPPEFRVLQTAASPLGSHRAYTLLVDDHTNATFGFSYEVVVLPGSAKIDMQHLPEPIWSAYSTSPEGLRWLDERTVGVELNQSDAHVSTIATHSVDGVSASVIFTSR